jgi:DNA-binding transcriptional ArsR family regulator
MATTFPHPKASELKLDQVLYALGDPLRLTMVRKMAKEGQVSCGDMCPVTAPSTLTHHLQILRESGVVFTEKNGQTHLNSLRADDLNARFPGLLDVILAGK